MTSSGTGYALSVFGSVGAHGVVLWTVAGLPQPALGPSATADLPIEVALSIAAPEVREAPPKAAALDFRARGERRTAGTRGSAAVRLAERKARQAEATVPNPPSPAAEPPKVAARQPQPEVLAAQVAETPIANTVTVAAGATSGAKTGRVNELQAGALVGPSTGSAGMGPAALGAMARDYAYRVHRLIADSASKQYPRAALRGHIEGRVLLAVTVDRHGRVTGVRVARTSGHVVLDRAAVAAVEALHSVPAPPAELPWRQEQTLPPLPVTYELRI